MQERRIPNLCFTKYPLNVIDMHLDKFTQANLKAVFQNLLFMIKWKQMTTAKWRCFDDILKMYTTQVLPLPPVGT